MERKFPYILGYMLMIGLGMSKGLDFKVTNMEDTPGLYYEHMGEAQLYNSEWKLVTYINLEEIENKFASINKFVEITSKLCQGHSESSWVNLTDCLPMLSYLPHKLKEIENTKLLIGQLVRKQESPLRARRGLFDFVGEVTKILFGVMDEDDAKYYTEKINKLEDEQSGILKLAKEQMTVVKSTLGAVNSTIKEVSENEKILLKGLNEIRDHLSEEDGEIKREFGYTSLTLTVNQHLIQLNRAMAEIRQDYEIILSAITNAQKGILQPHVVTPAEIIKVMDESREQIPKDLHLPFPLSVAYGSVILKLIDFDVFMCDKFLAYVIRIPLTDHIKYNVYKVIPFPIEIETKYVFIQPEKNYLFMDVAKRYYCKLDENDIGKCKVINDFWMVCKQGYPIKSTHVHEECEAKMLQPVRKIPADCSKRIVALNHSIWTQLDGNEWLFVAPNPETITILCQEQDPVDVSLKGTGKLQFMKRCKGYGLNVMIQSQTVLRNNVTNKDIIPPLDLKYDCCLESGINTKLSALQLDLPLKNVVTKMEDLKYASHKVEEVEKLIVDQEWKQKHSEKYTKLSFMAYAVLVMLFLIVSCYCCKCFKICWPKALEFCRERDSCTTIVFKPKIVNKLHTSEENVPRLSHEGEEEISLTTIPLAPSPKIITRAIYHGKR